MATNKKSLSNSAQLTPRPLRLRIDTQTEDVRVDVVPLIDVIFCILTFFLLSAVGLSRQQAISVDLPKANSGTPQGREILVVTLNELGQVYVEQQLVSTETAFRQKLRDYRQKNPDGLMALYGATNTSYSKVVQVLDLLRQEGGNRVALATLPGEKEQSSGFNPPVPPATGVPSYTPNPGESLPEPYGTQNPANPTIPTQPQVPGNQGQPLPSSPGNNLSSPPPLPGQSGVNAGTSTNPTPGAGVAPTTNSTPGTSTTPTPGTGVTPSTNSTPGTSTAPTPGTGVTPKTKSAP